jgi:nucleoside-diphosphate-sugar epimerase
MKILVTGGLGFIGSNFIEHLPRDWTVLNVDRCDYCARVHNVTPRKGYTYVQADITNMSKMKKLFADFQPDVVVHFAAQSHVDRSFENTWDYVNDNIVGTFTILECVKESGCKLLHISTDEVYGEVNLDEVSSPETSVLNPTNPYSATKAGAELLVRAYGHSFKIPYIITRGNNVFGPKQYPEKVVPVFIQSMLRGEPCTVHGEGLSRRNFIYVDDVSRAILTILEKGTNGTIYNIGTTNEYSVNELYDILRGIIDPCATKVHVGDRPHNDKRYAIDTTLLHALGWREETRFEDALQRTVEWYRDHPEWYA